MELDRSGYASIYGPTAGDRVRLGKYEIAIEKVRGASVEMARLTQCN